MSYAEDLIRWNQDHGSKLIEPDHADKLRQRIIKEHTTAPNSYLFTDCWIAAKTMQGHNTYVLSYLAFKGFIPSGKIIRHMCHQRLCCNPNHLKLGTIQDNTQDRVNRNKTDKKRQLGA